MKRWHKDAKSNLHVHIPEPFTQQEERIQLSRYGALSSEANTMIYYASKVETSYKTAKDEIARLTALFKNTFETNSASNNNSQQTPGNYRSNPNIVRDPIIIKTKGSAHQGSIRDRMHIDTPVGTVKRSRRCRIYYGIGHDARNFIERDRARSSREGPSSSEPTTKQGIASKVDNMLDSSQQSMNT
ncbi:hypothetical protein TorRG33x02_204040 [Trema orientale]|uniref:Uncharacterized protein n=1 Tax=Trema orientale TaxID=63057 RepID=A0A2P5EE87_TREOI|nr:hypothetical protein TorRG33x02_204040 [Trema orientale]